MLGKSKFEGYLLLKHTSSFYSKEAADGVIKLGDTLVLSLSVIREWLK